MDTGVYAFLQGTVRPAVDRETASTIFASTLTTKDVSDTIPRMEAEVQRFEEKLAHFVTLFQRLRSENNDLRQQLAAKSDEAKRVAEKLDQAKVRIEALVAQLPATEEERA